MPELPEVETIVRELNASNLIGLTILNIDILWDRTIATPPIAIFRESLVNQQIQSISRRGKFIVFQLTDCTLLVHLRMTGKFLFETDYHKHERVRITLSDKRTLRFDDQRKFGKWYLYSNPEEKFKEVGIEPLSDAFTYESFSGLLKKSKTALKPFLLNQKYITGLGNIYVDEALWDAKLHPLRAVNTLTEKEMKALYKAIPKVLKLGIEYMGTSLGSKHANYFSVSGRRGGNQTQLKVFRRDGLPCPRCGKLIEKIRVAQRGTHLCTHCQK